MLFLIDKGYSMIDNELFDKFVKNDPEYIRLQNIADTSAQEVNSFVFRKIESVKNSGQRKVSTQDEKTITKAIEVAAILRYRKDLTIEQQDSIKVLLLAAVDLVRKMKSDEINGIFPESIIP
jgi:formyltetrahydrofolate synthetase